MTEAERCAKIADALAEKWLASMPQSVFLPTFINGFVAGCEAVARAIRTDDAGKT